MWPPVTPSPEPGALLAGPGAAGSMAFSLQLGDMVTKQALRGRETAALLRGIFRGGWPRGCVPAGGHGELAGWVRAAGSSTGCEGRLW